MQALVSVRPSPLGLDVELPLVYPNGDTVVVTVARDGDGFVVHDSGNGYAALVAHGIAVTAKMAQRLEAIAQHYGCAFLSGRMTRPSDSDGLAVSVAIVANASRSIGDQMLGHRAAPIIDFKTEALEVLRSSIGAKRVVENSLVIGASGSHYSASAMILARDESTAVGLVEPVRDHEAATKKFREFWDISQNDEVRSLERIALYDDRRDWAASDLNLLQRVCNVVRLSDGFRRMQEMAA